MTRTKAVALLASIVLSVVAPRAFAVAQRTFVASTGNDANPCSLALPCRSFGAAITQTIVGGEVIALDSAGYGPVTITQSVSIIAAPGLYAGISVSSGHGVTIASSATDTVVLRGLTINNQGSDGRGIYITGAGVVRIADVRVSGFTDASGLRASPADVLHLDIRRSVFSNNATGIALNAVNGGTEVMQINAIFGDLEISNNTQGLILGNNTSATLSRSGIVNNSGPGLRTNPALGQTSRLSVDDCEIAQNNQAVYPGDTPGLSIFQLSRSRIVGNVTGIIAGENSTTRLSDNVIESNTSGIEIPVANGGLVLSAGNNVLQGNAGGEPILTTFPLR